MAENKLLKRSEVPEEYRWNMQDMFETDELWEQEAKELSEQLKTVEAYHGRLGESGETLLEFFKLRDEASHHLERIYVYANQKSHEDTAVSTYQGMASKADSLMVAFDSAFSFVDPEILEIPEEKLSKFYEDVPELGHYKRVIDVILRTKAHTLSEAEEIILAEAGDIATAPSNIFSMFNNADIKFPYITDVEGNKIRITHGNYIDMLLDKDRSIRKQAFEGVYDTYKKWGNTIAATYISQLKSDGFFAKMRKYDNSRQMYLASGNIPESVYDNLLAAVEKHLPSLHRYMALRKELLELNHLHMYDIFIPLIENVDARYTFEDAKELVAKALAPMGEDYVKVLEEGMESGWIDALENENKRSGAYSWGAYGTHPYVLLNYQENLDNVFTLAHEMGHAMHTYFSDKNQSVTYHEYLIFVAEVASTCNESLLMHYMLNNTEDDKVRLYLINHYLDGFRTTLFRQAQFAEFEHKAHKLVEAGEGLTKDKLCELYFEINQKYYGPAMSEDTAISYEWMRIPHFYTPYYVYQYSTGFSAAVAFSKMILEEGAPAVERYISNFLSAGSSKDPIDTLASAGVDMSTPKPIEDALAVFEEYLDMFEKAVKKLK